MTLQPPRPAAARAESKGGDQFFCPALPPPWFCNPSSPPTHVPQFAFHSMSIISTISAAADAPPELLTSTGHAGGRAPVLRPVSCLDC